jgi:hypothetical protein
VKPLIKGLNAPILYEALENIYEVYLFKYMHMYYIGGRYKGNDLPYTLTTDYGNAYSIYNKRLVYIKNLMYDKAKRKKRSSYV